MVFALVPGALILQPSPASAAEHFSGAWFIASFTDRLPPSDGSGRWRYWLDSQLRYSDIGEGANQLLIRPGIGYDINPSVSLWAGYARFRAHTRSGITVTEDRFWQQISWRLANWERSSLSLRFRVEERSLSTGSDTAIVLRTRMKYVRRLVPDRGVDLYVNLEPFVDFRDTDWGADAGLNRHRLQLGVGWRVTPKSRVEVGYLNSWNHIGGGEDIISHNLTVAFRSRF